jgi:DNA polymerase I
VGIFFGKNKRRFFWLLVFYNENSIYINVYSPTRYMMKKFFILDWSGFLYRAYYAFPFLTDTHGAHSHVVYGFVRMMLKILSQKPDYFVITRDSPTKTHRHEFYEEYKANRKKMEDDFKEQIPLTQKMVNDLWLANIFVPGYEADDIIATLVKTYKDDENIVIDVYSSDKDLKQLLAANVFCVDPMKNIRVDTKQFLQEFMFQPTFMLDYLSLVGDSSDNIPGVPWIWPKKASDLIKKYGDIDQIYAHLSDLPLDLQQKLSEHKELAYFSRKLVDLCMIPDFSSSLTDFAYSFDFEKYTSVLLDDLRFSSLLKTLGDMKKKLLTPQQTSLF